MLGALCATSPQAQRQQSQLVMDSDLENCEPKLSDSSLYVAVSYYLGYWSQQQKVDRVPMRSALLGFLLVRQGKYDKEKVRNSLGCGVSSTKAGTCVLKELCP